MSAVPVSTLEATAAVVAITLVVILLCVLLQYEGLMLLQRNLGHAHLGPRRLRVLFGIVGVLAMHATEILLFACGYAVADYIPAAGSIGGIGEHGHIRLLDVWYFSAITYTTVGYGDLAPVGALRFMAAAESLAGFVLVSWSASFTYLAMERFWGQRR
ncbi:MAG: two pore domain potassium channel family protein [Rhodanobacteraceae bacterium]|nr:two pore domain potassium channel family protein [Rhodanobacteraceae bacterium]